MTTWRRCEGGCGRELEIGPRGGGARVCLECRKAATLSAVEQMRTKQGPVYEKWKANHALATMRYARAVLDSPTK
jgi:hypothetical protein